MLKKLDVLVLILLPLLAVFASLVLKTNLIISTMLFFGLLALYLSWRTKRGIKRAMLFSFVVSTCFIVIDYIVVGDQGWYVPTIFPFRILGRVPMEDYIWYIFSSYTMLIFYEHFIDKGSHCLVAPNMKYFLSLLAVVVIGFGVTYFIWPNLLAVDFAYIKLGIIIIILPVLTMLVAYPKFLSKFILVATYFFFLNIIHELTALTLGLWSFPGVHFIGWVEILGRRFPFEEFIFFILLGPIALLSYFEYFDDNHLKREARRYT